MCYRVFHLLIFMAVFTAAFGQQGSLRLCAWEDRHGLSDTTVGLSGVVGGTPATDRGLLVIPVVVHIVWNSTEDNIPDAQIYSQIAALNRDFRGRSRSLCATFDLFAGAIADTGIEFCLAGVDPAGKATNGIHRVRTSATFRQPGDYHSVCYESRGGADAWDAKRYLNIWIADFDFAGYCPGLGAKPEEDGVYVRPDYFGTTGSAEQNPRFGLGHTCTHEVGHYLNLKHIWGDGASSCSDSDDVEDTPNQRGFTLGCPTSPDTSCGTVNMTVNFMDYTDDPCRSMFSRGQQRRMRAVLEGPRASLLSSGACNAAPEPAGVLEVFPNPACTILHIRRDTTVAATLSMYDALGRKVLSLIFSSGMDHPVDVTHLRPGWYHVRLQSGSRTEIQKVLIVR